LNNFGPKCSSYFAAGPKEVQEGQEEFLSNNTIDDLLSQPNIPASIVNTLLETKYQKMFYIIVN